jgi:hypothetical protein
MSWTVNQEYSKEHDLGNGIGKYGRIKTAQNFLLYNTS